MTPRLHEIARTAGVSEATVSRVVNDKPGVAEQTRATVLRALEEMGYPRGRTRLGTVGLIIPELDNPIFPAFAQAISTQLTSAGFATILCTLGAHVAETDYVSMLTGRGVDGIVFVCGLHANSEAEHSHYTALAKRNVPTAFVNGTIEGFAAPFISVDDGASAELAVQHLVSLGHRRIGLAVGMRRFVPAARKIAGYERAMTAAFGAVPDELILEGLFWFEGGHFAIDALIERDITALICGSDMMALGAIDTARQRGLDVPRDISIVGFDDIPVARFTDPPLTTIAQPVQAMGAATVRALLEQIQSATVHAGEFMFPPDLVVRGSTGPVIEGARARKGTTG
jgi:alanine racemase